MNKEQILAMQPGTDLNLKVAEEVMGYLVVMDEHLGWLERLVNPIDGGSVWSLLQPYSEDIAAAEQVVDRMAESGYKDTARWADFGGGKHTRPEAICKAALLAVLERRRVEKTSNEILNQAFGDEL